MPEDTANQERYRLIGGNGSPYSMKLRAIMRYRRLPFDWVLRTERVMPEIAQVRPALMPVLRYPEDGSYRVDSTPLALDLEARHDNGRGILPDDPAHAFLCLLLEDMADEFLTKCMFHYRWAYADDQDFSSHWIIDDARPDLEGAAYDEAVAQIAARQISRMALVGCTPANAPGIEEFYGRVLDALAPHVGVYRYLFGSRPSLADFGFFGQLKTLGDDPTPRDIMRRRALRVLDWVRQLDDASGIEGDWLGRGEPLPAATEALLALAGEVYLPFLLANAAAIETGDDEFQMTVFDRPYRQGTFRYQVKCLDFLRQRYGALDGEARARLDAILDKTGCLSSLAS